MNKETYNTPNRVSSLILFIGVVIIVIFGYLFIVSYDWSWSSSGSYGGHKSFTEYGLNYHKRPTYFHDDYSWLKWIFYPFDVFVFLIGCILISIGLKRWTKNAFPPYKFFFHETIKGGKIMERFKIISSNIRSWKISWKSDADINIWNWKRI